MRLLLIAGARPNFMKVAPLMREFRSRPDLYDARLVHTGQHYDELMSDVFFDELEIPRPDIHLGVGSASHAVQTARIMEAFEKVMLEQRPDWVVVVGDVNSTLACSVVATKMSPPVRVAHVEAGLRSRDRTMPEEINRIVTDALSDLLFTTSPDADANLRAEGVDRRKIHRVGNVMIDTLRRFVERSDGSDVMRRLGIEPPFALLTLHRPSNVDDPASLRRIFAALERIGRDVPIIFPVHPRTVKMMDRFGLRPAATVPPTRAMIGLRLVEPLGYLDFLHLQKRAALVLTDSGGIQEETTILGVPCLTLRENTERPVTLTHGTNRLVGSATEKIVREARRILKSPPGRPAARAASRGASHSAARAARKPRVPLWDGRAAARIAAVFASLALRPRG
ncbi:MAG TPA: UDP-N-acetylglucosamine 2-epimerase (non-hydrolyzing) [Candidatus Polarisedimenticolia bacterium]|nr:UDP-N-acetylglucosamine 2-epimerase (non-hydrolyzing) [Candidatus Polarisedimenticolia bacterium]